MPSIPRFKTERLVNAIGELRVYKDERVKSMPDGFEKGMAWEAEPAQMAPLQGALYTEYIIHVDAPTCNGQSEGSASHVKPVKVEAAIPDDDVGSGAVGQQEPDDFELELEGQVSQLLNEEATE
eukprot:2130219-Amphidinium_carterae.1